VALYRSTPAYDVHTVLLGSTAKISHSSSYRLLYHGTFSLNSPVRIEEGVDVLPVYVCEAMIERI